VGYELKKERFLILLEEYFFLNQVRQGIKKKEKI
jgi:hypothetical protein